MKIIILGAGRVGQSVAESLVSERNDITVIDTDANRVRDLEGHFDLRGVVGNGIDPAVLAEAGANDTDLVIACAAQDADWSEEYLAPIISIKVVAGVDEAIAHINRYSSHHTDAVLTTDHVHAQRFLREVDSASVMVNASTRFADGFEYGLGAEIGISTDKFHARGPVGIEGLTSLKWIVLGEGEVRG